MCLNHHETTIGVSARGARGAPAPPERKSSRLRGKASEETCPLCLTLLNSYLFGFEMYVIQFPVPLKFAIHQSIPHR